MKRTVICFAACAAFALAASETLTAAVFSLTANGGGGRLSSSSLERTASVYHSYEFHPITDTPTPEGFVPFAGPYYRWQDLREHVSRTIERIGDLK